MGTLEQGPTHWPKNDLPPLPELFGSHWPKTWRARLNPEEWHPHVLAIDDAGLASEWGQTHQVPTFYKTVTEGDRKQHSLTYLVRGITHAISVTADTLPQAEVSMRNALSTAMTAGNTNLGDGQPDVVTALVSEQIQRDFKRKTP